MGNSQEWFLEKLILPADFRFGHIRLRGANDLPLTDGFINLEAGEAVIRLSAECGAPWGGHSMVVVYMFQLPKGQKELDSLIDWFGGERLKKPRLPEKIPFESSMLSLQGVPQCWEHDWFAVSSRNLFHIYRSKKTGVLLRYFSKNGTMLDNPFFKMIHQNLLFSENQWITAFPKLTLKKSATQTIAKKPVKALIKELSEAVQRARVSLVLKANDKSARVVQGIAKGIDEARSPGKKLAQIDNLAIALGALWGETVCRTCGWQWMKIQEPGKSGHAEVCSPDKAFRVNPIARIYDLLKNKRLPNNSALLFNMIEAGALPQSVAGALMPLN